MTPASSDRSSGESSLPPDSSSSRAPAEGSLSCHRPLRLSTRRRSVMPAASSRRSAVSWYVDVKARDGNGLPSRSGSWKPGSATSLSSRSSVLRTASATGRAIVTNVCSPGVHPTVPLSSLPRSIVAPMTKVLVIEDDAVIADGIVQHLSAAGFEAVSVGGGEPGLARLRYEQPDVCVLDLMLPGLDGWKLIETVRGEGIGTPIVVISARGTEHDRVHALEIGADDYLVKPFSMKELVARVTAAGRRGGQSQPATQRGEAIEIEELRIDPREVQAYVDGESADADAHRVPAALRARARAGPRRLARRVAAAALGPAAGPPRPHRRRLRAPAAGEDRPPRVAAHVHPDAVRRRLQARARAKVTAWSPDLGRGVTAAERTLVA